LTFPLLSNLPEPGGTRNDISLEPVCQARPPACATHRLCLDIIDAHTIKRHASRLVKHAMDVGTPRENAAVMMTKPVISNLPIPGAEEKT
jgi:hypothetical protein